MLVCSGGGHEAHRVDLTGLQVSCYHCHVGWLVSLVQTINLLFCITFRLHQQWTVVARVLLGLRSQKITLAIVFGAASVIIDVLWSSYLRRDRYAEIGVFSCNARLFHRVVSLSPYLLSRPLYPGNHWLIRLQSTTIAGFFNFTILMLLILLLLRGSQRWNLKRLTLQFIGTF